MLLAQLPLEVSDAPLLGFDDGEQVVELVLQRGQDGDQVRRRPASGGRRLGAVGHGCS
jgi:hypothetical protein